MSDRAQIRREVVAELVELAERHRAGHEELYHSAVEHGREEMEQRAYAGWNAWGEVKRILRFELNPVRRRLASVRGGSQSGGRTISP